MNRDRPIYLDYQSTTPVDPEVASAMLPYLTDKFGNPHSEHKYGWDAAEVVDEAKENVANLLSASPAEVVITSGATESNCSAILGSAKLTARRHVVVSSIEHKSVLVPATDLTQLGFNVTTLPVHSDGTIDLDVLEELLTEDTALVSVMAANNEIGTLQPLEDIAEMCARVGALFHTDASQLAGKRPIDAAEIGVHLLSLSAHKFYGPKGVGALYVASEIRNKLSPLIRGGGQQDGMRSGTLAPMLCAGLSAAARKAATQFDADEIHALELRAEVLSDMRSKFPEIRINGQENGGLAGCLNICIPGVNSHALLMSLQTDLAASVNSACNAGLFETSHVLRAIGLTPEDANSSLRLGFGRMTTLDEVKEATRLISEAAERQIANKTAAHVRA